MMEIVKEKGFNLQYASDKLRSDKEIVMEAVKRNGMAIQFASEELKDDKEIVMIALESMDQAYIYVSNRLCNDTDVMLKTLSTALKYPNRHRIYSVQGKLGELFNDRELILKIPMVNGYSALKYANSEFRNDKELVLKAIKQIPGELEREDSFDFQMNFQMILWISLKYDRT